MKFYYNMSQEVAKAQCYRLLKECIDFDHIEDGEFICKNLSEIKAYRGTLPDKTYTCIERFIQDVIYPIVNDSNYFDFMKREEFGSYNEKGYFEINSKRSLEIMVCLLCEHTIVLERKLNNFASKHLY